MKIFDQYVELPSQYFETIESVVMPDKEYKIDSTLIHLYSIMMNHQDNSIKFKHSYYSESYDSLAWLTHTSPATISRKIDQLIQMGLLVQVYRHKKTSVWIVKPLSDIKEEVLIRRKSEKEMVQEAILNKMENLVFQNETQIEKNETHFNNFETKTEKFETKTNNFDVVNNSNNNSQSNSENNSLLAVMGNEGMDNQTSPNQDELENDSSSTVSISSSPCTSNSPDLTVVEPLEEVTTVTPNDSTRRVTPQYFTISNDYDLYSLSLEAATYYNQGENEALIINNARRLLAGEEIKLCKGYVTEKVLAYSDSPF